MRTLTVNVAISAAGVLAICGLTGCDLIYGIKGEQDITKSTDHACIVSALRHSSGVPDVTEVHRLETATVILGNGPNKGSAIDYYFYWVGSDHMQRANLMVEQYPDGHYRYTDEMLSMGRRMPDVLIAQALPAMTKAMQSVAETCNLPELLALRHSCIGYQCPT